MINKEAEVKELVQDYVVAGVGAHVCLNLKV